MSFSKEFHTAMAMLDKLRKSGFRTVPLEPSPEMLAAGAAISKLPIEVVDKVYRAMVKAADPD
jgi:hypothetical protein